ncbi:hypothetical protein [Planktotalea sp.]|uniref:hypothetical protein n=1 Tax=Planktotalea sp. TaxID=2029877 RepID=UPI003299D60F
MKKTFTMLVSILAMISLLDQSVMGLLSWAESNGKLGSLVRYFEYGRSVPGKLAKWEDNPDNLYNLYDLAWRGEIIDASTHSFDAEQENPRPVIRSYGMSFVDNILLAAKEDNPDLTLDMHSGPSAPPNFTFALFQDDIANRRDGDIAVFGILSSSVSGLAAMSNRTWAFEQPAPFTYPVYHLVDGALHRMEPLINSGDAERSLRYRPFVFDAWTEQLSNEDQFYFSATFGATWLDFSPFARLVRRSFAQAHVTQVQENIRNGSYPCEEVLQLMITDFARTARQNGQRPVVMLIQSRDPDDLDLLEIAKPVFEKFDIPYLATAEHFDPRYASGFLADGHYKPEVDKQFAAAFAELLGSLPAN